MRDDHSVACYDVHSGEKLWCVETLRTDSTFVAFAGDDGNVVVQDETGILLLRSGETGDILAVSSTVLPPVVSAENRGESLYVRWRDGARFGMAIVSVDEDQFGPYSNIPQAFGLSADASQAVVCGSTADEVLMVPCPTLDELVDLAHETVQGFELTRDERLLYRIGD